MRHRILVVAEDVTLRSTLAQWLMPAGYFVELAETDRRAREVLAKQPMALIIVAPSAGVPMFDPGEKGGKLIVATDRPHDPAGSADLHLWPTRIFRYPWTIRRCWRG